MAVKHRTSYENRRLAGRQFYVYGNVAERPEEVRSRGGRRQRRTSRQVRRNRRRVMNLSVSYTLFLILAATAAVFICVSYLRLQAELVNRSEHITKLQQDLSQMKEDNNTAYQAAEDSANLQTIRDKALNELGMVYASQGHVITYKGEAGDSVTQYNDIPKSGVLAASEDTSK